MNLKKIVNILVLLLFANASVQAGVCPEREFKCPEGEVFYLTSFSVPETSLRTIIKEAFLRNGRTHIVFRGLPDKKSGDFPVWTIKELTHKLKGIADEVAREIVRQNFEAPGKLRIAIDPVLFRKLKVKTVPVIVFCEPNNTYRMLIGDVSLEMAEYYLRTFDRKVVAYGPQYEIKERDLINVAIEYEKTHEKPLNRKTIAERAIKKVFTGYRLPRAEAYRKKTYTLSDLILARRNDILQKISLAEDVPPQIWSQIFLLDEAEAQKIARTTAMLHKDEEVIMVDASDEKQVNWALNELKSNPKAVVLMSGYMLPYYKRYPLKVFPLKKWQAEKWNITSLPARVKLTSDAKVVVEEGFLFNSQR